MNTLPARASRAEPDFAEEVLDEVRQAVQVEDDVLKEARKRRDLVKREAGKYSGALRPYNAGSIAHGTAKNPLPDADCGEVLDRRRYPDLGPDGRGVGPEEIVPAIAEEIFERLVAEYPKAACRLSKRAIVLSFNEPIGDEDPSVDLIIALDRSEGPGLWIPNLKAGRWDPSDPEKHTELLTAPPADLRRFRARLIRLAKAAIAQDGEKAVIISFNVEALALALISETDKLAEGLRDLFLGSATLLQNGNTPDPAGISPPIKLPEGVSREQAVRRLRFFAGRVAEAIEHRDDRDHVVAALADVFPEQLSPTSRSGKSDLAEALRGGHRNPSVQVALGAGAERLKEVRSYGHRASR